MTSRIRNITFDAGDPHRSAHFWADVLGADVEERGGVAFVTGQGPRLFFQPGRPTVHLDVTPESSMQDEVDRLVALGARVVRAHEEYGWAWTVLTDPDGTEFCVSLGKADTGETDLWPD